MLLSSFSSEKLATLISEPDIKEEMASLHPSASTQTISGQEILKQLSESYLPGQPSLSKIKKAVKHGLDGKPEGALKEFYEKIQEKAEQIINGEGAEWSKARYVCAIGAIGAGIGAAVLGAAGAGGGALVGAVTIPVVGAVPGLFLGGAGGVIGGSSLGFVVGALVGLKRYRVKQLQAVTKALEDQEFQALFTKVKLNQLLPKVFELSFQSAAEALKGCYTATEELPWCPVKKGGGTLEICDFNKFPQSTPGSDYLKYEPDFETAAKIHYFFIGWMEEISCDFVDDDLIKNLKNCKLKIYDSLDSSFKLFSEFIETRTRKNPAAPSLPHYKFEEAVQQAALQYRKNPIPACHSRLSDAVNVCPTDLKPRMVHAMQEAEKAVKEGRN